MNLESGNNIVNLDAYKAGKNAETAVSKELPIMLEQAVGQSTDLQLKLRARGIGIGLEKKLLNDPEVVRLFDLAKLLQQGNERAHETLQRFYKENNTNSKDAIGEAIEFLNRSIAEVEQWLATHESENR